MVSIRSYLVCMVSTAYYKDLDSIKCCLLLRIRGRGGRFFGIQRRHLRCRGTHPSHLVGRREDAAVGTIAEQALAEEEQGVVEHGGSDDRPAIGLRLHQL